MTTKTRQPAAPKHLSVAAKRLWKSILRRWAITDAASLAILAATLEAKDRAERARKLVDRLGELLEDRFEQQKVNPACAVERDARAQFLAGLKQLGLEPPTDQIPPDPPPRPIATRTR